MRDNRIESLAIACQLSAHTWLHVCNDDLRIPTKITETYRDKARQVEVRASGASPLKFGFHNLRLAVDWACYDETGIYITDGTHPHYKRCGRIWQALGWTWGGSWQKADYCHAQYDGGIWRIDDYLKAHPEALAVEA